MDWILLLIFLGILLIAIETHVPGLVIGAIGFICLLAAAALAYLKYGFTGGTLILLGIFVLLIISALLWRYIFPKTPLGKIMITSKTLEQSKTSRDLNSLLGKQGKALTALRPSGNAIINNQTFDVLAEIGFIDKETPIEVVRVEGNRVFVKKS